MTEERAKKNIKNSKRFTKIVSWSLENKALWSKFCYCFDNDLTTEDICRIMDECKHHGFMEIYYMLLTKLGSIIDLNVRDQKFIEFIENSLDKDIKLDMKKLRDIQPHQELDIT